MFHIQLYGVSVISSSVLSFSWNSKLHCQVRGNEGGFHHPTFPQLFSNLGILSRFIFSYYRRFPLSTPRHRPVMRCRRCQDYVQAGRAAAVPKGTALRACPNPLHTSGGGSFLSKGKLQATVHLQIHGYRLKCIMIQRKSSFIFALGVHPVSITHGRATEKPRGGVTR